MKNIIKCAVRTKIIVKIDNLFKSLDRYINKSVYNLIFDCVWRSTGASIRNQLEKDLEDKNV